MTHASEKSVIVVSYINLPDRHQAIIWTSDGKIVIHKDACENNVCKMATISRTPRLISAWYLFVKLEELHIVTARKPLIHQNQPVAQYLHKIQSCML